LQRLRQDNSSALMDLCSQCSEQQDKPANNSGHALLRLIDPGPLTPEGWRQTWECQKCGAVWLRVDTPLPGTPHRWTVFGRSVLEEL
jgi:hypothetical protein